MPTVVVNRMIEQIRKIEGVGSVTAAGSKADRNFAERGEAAEETRYLVELG